MSRVMSKQAPAALPTAKSTVIPADPVDASITELIVKGKTRGFLTWEELNDALPDEAVMPDRLESILFRLEENGIDMIDEADAEKLTGKADPAAKKAAVGPVVVGVATIEDDATVEAPSRRIDDPVRMYLTQMGEIPLLMRTEEISLAKKIELTRMAFRRKVLESDCSLNTAAELLQSVHDGTLPFDRTMKISTGENQAKQTVLQRLPGNLKTARKLMEQNQEDWVKLEDSNLSEKAHDEIVRAINKRRRKCVRLFEELALRTSKVTPMMRKLYALSDKMMDLERKLNDPRVVDSMPAEEIEAMRDELAGLQDLVLESPQVLRRRVLDVRRIYAEYEDAKRKLSGGNLRLVVSIAKKYRNR